MTGDAAEVSLENISVKLSSLSKTGTQMPTGDGCRYFI